MIFISMVSPSLALKQRLEPTRNGNGPSSWRQKKKQNLPSFWNKVFKFRGDWVGVMTNCTMGLFWRWILTCSFLRNFVLANKKKQQRPQTCPSCNSTQRRPRVTRNLRMACEQAFGRAGWGEGKAKRPVDKHLGPPFHGTRCASDPDASSYWREHWLLTGLIDIGFSVGT